MSERKTNQKRTDYIAAIVATHGGTQENYTRKELRAVSDSHGWKWIPNWITHDKARRVSRGVFSIPEAFIVTETPTEVTEELMETVAAHVEEHVGAEPMPV
tara:strand:+ start:384 stop:686 length:303 start_codon:yes stop_codon:yes gene_type:complete